MNQGVFDLIEPKTVLVVEAHPDDAALFAGGTIALLASEGHRVVNVCSTYGEKGTLDSSKTLDEMIETEKHEAQQAAKILGINEPIFLGIPDGELVAGLELRRTFTEIIRRVQPDVVLSFDPHIPYDPHPDHQAVGRTLYEACFTSHFPLYYPRQISQGLEPHYVNWFYGWRSTSPNIVIDISKTLETKIRAIQQYESQMQMLLQETRERLQRADLPVPALDDLEWKEFVRLWVTLNAQQTDKQAGIDFGEAFHRFGYGILDMLPKLQEKQD
jgi:LmbE family N-acetylglucosaminyl deacetylase